MKILDWLALILGPETRLRCPDQHAYCRLCVRGGVRYPGVEILPKWDGRQYHSISLNDRTDSTDFLSE